jgi:hypothetical protein
MGPFLWGGIIGSVLAVLNLWASFLYSSRVVVSAKPFAVGLALIGFAVRLTLLALIFYGLSGFKAIHFRTTLISFIVAYSGCLLWKSARLLLKPGVLAPKESET